MLILPGERKKRFMACELLFAQLLEVCSLCRPTRRGTLWQAEGLNDVILFDALTGHDEAVGDLWHLAGMCSDVVFQTSFASGPLNFIANDVGGERCQARCLLITVANMASEQNNSSYSQILDFAI
jgi:hypothetical protein